MKANQIDINPLREELKEQVGNLKFSLKLDAKAHSRVCTSYTDRAIAMTINPKHIHTLGQLDRTFDDCRDAVMEDY